MGWHMQKLLLIDDDQGISSVVGLISANVGMAFKSVSDPVLATQAFVDYRPDIVMLDMIMPEKDGIDVLQALFVTGIPTRFILTSGYGDAYLRMAAGIATFHGACPPDILAKPFRCTELRALLCGPSPVSPTDVQRVKLIPSAATPTTPSWFSHER